MFLAFAWSGRPFLHSNFSFSGAIVAQLAFVMNSKNSGLPKIGDRLPGIYDRITPTILDEVIRMFRHALSSLRRNPGFTGAAVLSLALGIGTTTVLFSLADAILLRPFLQVREPERLVGLYSRSARGDWSSLSYPDYLDYSAQADVFEGLMAYVRLPFSFNAGSRTELLWGEQVTWNYFDVHGTGMSQGRGFRPEDVVRQGGDPRIRRCRLEPVELQHHQPRLL